LKISALKITPEVVRIIRHGITIRPVLMGANRKALVANSVRETLYEKMTRSADESIEEPWCGCVSTGKKV